MNLANLFDRIANRLAPSSDRILYEDHPNGRARVFAIHNDYKSKVDLGPEVSHPRHTFTGLDEFAAWLNREAAQGRMKPADVTLLVGEQSITASCVDYQIDGALVSCTLESHPGWDSWMRARGAWLNTGQVFDLVREVADTFADRIVKVDGENVVTSGADPVLAALMGLEVVQGSDATIQRNAKGMVTFAGSNDKTTVNDSIKPTWALRLAPFAAAPDIYVDLDVNVSMKWDKDEKEMRFRLTLPGAKVARREAQSELAGVLGAQLGESWLVGMGLHKTNTSTGLINS